MGVNALGPRRVRYSVEATVYTQYAVVTSENFIVALLRCIGLLYIFLLYREAVELPTMRMRHATRTIARRSHAYRLQRVRIERTSYIVALPLVVPLSSSSAVCHTGTQAVCRSSFEDRKV